MHPKSRETKRKLREKEKVNRYALQQNLIEAVEFLAKATEYMQKNMKQQSSWYQRIFCERRRRESDVFTRIALDSIHTSRKQAMGKLSQFAIESCDRANSFHGNKQYSRDKDIGSTER